MAGKCIKHSRYKCISRADCVYDFFCVIAWTPAVYVSPFVVATGTTLKDASTLVAPCTAEQSAKRIGKSFTIAHIIVIR
jgi:hypothetical protein